MTTLEDLKRRDQELATAREVLGNREVPASRANFKAMVADLPVVSDEELRAADAGRVKRLGDFKQRLWRAKVFDAAPVRVVRKVFELEQRPAVQAVQKWLDDGCQHDLVLRGGVGTGKSTAACLAVKHWCEPDVALDAAGEPYEKQTTKELCVSWLRPHALVSAVEHAYDSSAPKLRKYVVLEDIGRETRPEFVEAFCELLDRDGHTILITTNLKRDQMRERYDVRVLERLAERARPVDVPGESMRRKDVGF
jgi:DNA replication protein DnaC